MTKLIGGAALACLALLVVATSALATASSSFSMEQTEVAGSSTAESVSASRWVATDLGNLGQARVVPADINDRGQVVGGSRTKGGGSRGFVWRNGAMQGLGRGPFAHAGAINERGQIIGTSSSAAMPEEHAVLWQNGRMTDLLPRGGVTAINEQGQILGFRYVPTGNGFTPTSVIWENGKMQDLGFLGSAINDRGQVVGGENRNDGHALVWQNGKITDLGPGLAIDINDRGDVLEQRAERVILWRDSVEIDLGSGFPAAMNERGQVTGFKRTATGDWHAFLWQNGRMTDLGTLGGKWSFPTAISNRGQIVGFSSDRSGVQHAFLWQNGTMIKLGSPKGKTGLHAFRTRAIAINEHNQIIGDNCFQDCSRRAEWATSKFAVIWTLRRTTVTASGATSTRDLQAPRNGEWIAYSTVPGDGLWRRAGNPTGSDVFVVRQGREPKLVAGRRDGKTWNVCPAFSPDGTMLAFGTTSPAGQSLSVVRMTRAGRRAHLKVHEGRLPPCPQWSANSSRVAYVRNGKVIVRGLDGSSRRRRGWRSRPSGFRREARSFASFAHGRSRRAPATLRLRRGRRAARRLRPSPLARRLPRRLCGGRLVAGRPEGSW